MKKSAFVALVVFGVLPFSACNNGEQNGYMESSTAEANAREAELAEQEFTELAAKEKQPQTKTGKVAKHESKTARQPSSVKAANSATTHTPTWVVQMGAFKVKENADKLTAQLKADGFPVVMRSMNHSKNGEFYIVHLEPTPNKTEAEKWQSDLKMKSFDSQIVSHRQ